MAKAKPSVVQKVQRRVDGWVNLLTGLGNRLRDKTLSASFCAERLDWNTQRELYRGNDIAARIIEAIPDEMIREGFELKIEGDKSVCEEAMAAGEQLGILEKLHQAWCWERAYGGAAILLGADDGQKDLTKPLNLNAIRSLKYLNVLQPRELVPTRYYSDALSPKFGKPELYRLQPLIVDARDSRQGAYPEVHETRLILFEGVSVDTIQVRENLGWGDSVLNRCHRVISQFDLTWDSAANLIADFSQAVVKMKGLNALIADNDDDVILARAQMMDATRSVARALLLDSEDDFERKPTPITGLPDVMDRFSNRLAAAAQMPVTVLMGQAPAGLNATGASDIRAWYDKISATQERKGKPALKYFFTVLFRAKDGPTKGREPKNWSIEFNPLWQLDETAKADIRLKQAQTDQIYINTQVVTPDEVALSRFGGDGYSTETVVDFDAREELAKQEEDEEANQPIPPPAAIPPTAVPEDLEMDPATPNGTPPAKAAAAGKGPP